MVRCRPQGSAAGRLCGGPVFSPQNSVPGDSLSPAALILAKGDSKPDW